LQENGLSKKKAIVALARRLLVRCWAILGTGRPRRAPEPAVGCSGPRSHRATGSSGG